jgi:oligoribonuclease (3'-5' exoribonuclease)
MADKPKRWIWLDLEMTGLDVPSNRILEIATLVTDTELNILAEGHPSAGSTPSGDGCLVYPATCQIWPF